MTATESRARERERERDPADRKSGETVRRRLIEALYEPTTHDGKTRLNFRNGRARRAADLQSHAFE